MARRDNAYRLVRQQVGVDHRSSKHFSAIRSLPEMYPTPLTPPTKIFACRIPDGLRHSPPSQNLGRLVR